MTTPKPTAKAIDTAHFMPPAAPAWYLAPALPAIVPSVSAAPEVQPGNSEPAARARGEAQRKVQRQCTWELPRGSRMEELLDPAGNRLLLRLYLGDYRVLHFEFLAGSIRGVSYDRCLPHREQIPVHRVRVNTASEFMDGLQSTLAGPTLTRKPLPRTLYSLQFLQDSGKRKTSRPVGQCNGVGSSRVQEAQDSKIVVELVAIEAKINGRRRRLSSFLPRS